MAKQSYNSGKIEGGSAKSKSAGYLRKLLGKKKPDDARRHNKVDFDINKMNNPPSKWLHEHYGDNKQPVNVDENKEPDNKKKKKRTSEN
jgi:hypothetical protein